MRTEVNEGEAVGMVLESDMFTGEGAADMAHALVPTQATASIEWHEAALRRAVEAWRGRMKR